VPSPTSTQQNIFIVSYAANGAVLWQDTYDNGNDQENAYDLVRDTSSGAIYVVGGVSGKNGGNRRHPLGRGWAPALGEAILRAWSRDLRGGRRVIDPGETSSSPVLLVPPNAQVDFRS
jgi:hypothetical protein